MVLRLSTFILVMHLLNQGVFAQDAPTTDAYKLFRSRGSGMKIRYLGAIPNSSFPLLAQKLSVYQNRSFAKFGIRRVVVIREFNGALDTVAIRRYNAEGYLVQRDTFDLMYADRGNKNLHTTHYDYFLEDKIVRVKSRDIVFKPDTSYEWQESLKAVFYYDGKNRLFRRDSWHSANDTLKMYFENDANDILIGIRSYPVKPATQSDQKFEYRVDKKGRLTDFIRYYKYNGLIPEEKSNYGAYNVSSLVSRFVYNDREKSVTMYREQSCHKTYYFFKRRQVFMDHFCPMVEDKVTHRSVPGESNSARVYETGLDRHLRVKSVSVSTRLKTEDEKKQPTSRIVTNYEYNRNGLVSAVITRATSPGWDQKIHFYYLTN